VLTLGYGPGIGVAHRWLDVLEDLGPFTARFVGGQQWLGPQPLLLAPSAPAFQKVSNYT
jgi:hypothetical protein